MAIMCVDYVRDPCFFFFNDPATTEIYTLSLHDALPISATFASGPACSNGSPPENVTPRSEEHTSELQSLRHLVCRLLLEKKKHQFLERELLPLELVLEPAQRTLPLFRAQPRLPIIVLCL